MTFIIKLMTSQTGLFTRDETGLYKLFSKANLSMYVKLASKIWFHFVSNLQRYTTISAHVPKRAW